MASSDVVVVEANVRQEMTERVRVRVHGCTSLETKGKRGGSKYWASPAVHLAGRKWKLCLFPKGFSAGLGTHFGVTVYLSPGQGIVKARFKLTIVENSQTLISSTEEFKDQAGGHDWGRGQALTIADFKSLAAAHGDTLTFEIEITTFGEPTSSVQPRAARMAAAAATAAAHAAVVKDLGALLDGGKNTDVVFRVAGEDIAAHRSLLAARSPVFEAMFARHWSEQAASSSSGSAEGGGAIAIEGTAPAAFKQLLRFAYTGCCEDGALAAMADHLFEAAGKFGLPTLQAAARQQMVSALDAAKVCDYFALAHAHEDEALKDACAALVFDDMLTVSQTEGFKRLSAERPLLACALIQSMGELKSPEGRKRKRDEGGAGCATEKKLMTKEELRMEMRRFAGAPSTWASL